MDMESIKEGLVVYPLLVASLVFMFLGGKIFLIGTLIFFSLAGAFEWVIMRNFWVSKKSIVKIRKNSSKIINGLVWVHGIIEFMKKRRATLYHYKSFGYLPLATAYSVMFMYTLIGFVLYKQFGNFAFIIYLIPIITNSIVFLKNKYGILSR